jgi:hypothetical protein
VVSALQRRRSSGQPLPDDVAQKFGESFGADLSGVRLHTDTEADHLARSVDAAAFTYGHDVYFAAGTYSGARTDDRLLAHELAHVAQQRGGPSAVSGSAPIIGAAGDPREAEADRMADTALSALRRRASTQSIGAVDPALSRVTVAQLRALRENENTEDEHEQTGETETPAGQTAPADTGVSTGEVETDTGELETDTGETESPGVQNAINNELANVEAETEALDADLDSAGGDTDEQSATEQTAGNQLEPSLLLKIALFSAASELLRLGAPDSTTETDRGALRQAALALLAKDRWITAMTELDTFEDLRLFVESRLGMLVAQVNAAMGKEDSGANLATQLADLFTQAGSAGGQEGEAEAELQTLEAAATLVYFDGGLLVHRDSEDSVQPVDTTESIAPVAGTGWAMFVVGSDNKLHLLPAATEMDPADVVADAPKIVGEIAVKAGSIERMTLATDRPVPSIEDVQQFLGALQAAGVNLDFEIVGLPGQGPHIALQILETGGSAGTAQAPAEEPTPAQNETEQALNATG